MRKNNIAGTRKDVCMGIRVRKSFPNMVYKGYPVGCGIPRRYAPVIISPASWKQMVGYKVKR